MIALLFSIASSANAAELADALPTSEGLGFATPSGEVFEADFQNAPASELAPWAWVAPGQELLAWGVLVEDSSALDGLVWLEVEGVAGAPVLLIVSDRLGDPALADFGSGELVAWVQADEGPFVGWPTEALSLIVEAWEDLPDGPLVEDSGGEVTVDATTSAILIVLLPGCFPDETDGNTGDNGDPNLDEDDEDTEAAEDEEGNSDEETVE